MNTIDTGNATRAAAGALRQSFGDDGAANSGLNTQPQQAPRRDEYVPSNSNRVSNALYDVSNVSKGSISRFSSRLQVGRVTASGEKIGRKVVEILLPTGKKSLTIYQKQR